MVLFLMAYVKYVKYVGEPRPAPNPRGTAPRTSRPRTGGGGRCGRVVSDSVSPVRKAHVQDARLRQRAGTNAPPSFRSEISGLLPSTEASVPRGLTVPTGVMSRPLRWRCDMRDPLTAQWSLPGTKPR